METYRHIYMHSEHIHVHLIKGNLDHNIKFQTLVTSESNVRVESPLFYLVTNG